MEVTRYPAELQFFSDEYQAGRVGALLKEFCTWAYYRGIKDTHTLYGQLHPEKLLKINCLDVESCYGGKEPKDLEVFSIAEKEKIIRLCQWFYLEGQEDFCYYVNKDWVLH